MKTIFKKSLAFAVCAALCLTAFMGCLTVRADAVPTITAATVTAEPSETVVVPIAFTDMAGVCATKVIATFDDDLTIVSAADADTTDPFFVEYTAQDGGNFVIDGNTIKFVDIINFPNEISNSALTLNVTVTAPADEGQYDVTLAAEAASYAEELVEVTLVDGAVNVEEAIITPPEPEDDIVFGAAAYNIAQSKLSVPYTLNQSFKDALSYAKNTAGGRVVYEMVSIDGDEFAFETSMYNAGTLEVAGFALSHMDAGISVWVKITANGGYVYESNATAIVLDDIVSAMAATDPSAAAFVDLVAARDAAQSEAISATAAATIETGLLDFGTVTYKPYASELSVTYGAPSQDIKNVLSAAKTAGNRKVQLIVAMGGSEFAFDVSIMSAGGALSAAGFGLTHFDLDVEMFVRISADNFDTVETNKVTVSIADVLAGATGSDFATAYAAYIA